MIVCEDTRPAPLRCPTPGEVLASTMALLPRGRAWQSTEGGPKPGVVQAFDSPAFDDEAFQTKTRPPSVLLQFWQAVAQVFSFVNARLCDLRLEFWCATHKETHDLWMLEYGLPDECDPFPDLCTKVAAIGGTRCEYYAFIAARAGWDISCETDIGCGARPGCISALAGRAIPGKTRYASRLRVFINLDQSPAYTGAALTTRPLAGRFLAGRRMLCVETITDINITPLECIMARVVHAEIEIVYEVISNV